MAVARVRLSAASVSLGAASHRQRLQIVAQAKGGKKKVKRFVNHVESSLSHVERSKRGHNRWNQTLDRF
jgi:hypothetical protein